MNKTHRAYPRPLAEFIVPCIGEVFARQGFAASELVTHWPDIVGEEIAACAEPLKLNWPRDADAGGNGGEPATLVLRVEGPAAIEIQHLAPVILERVNRFLGWRAVGRLRLRQAPNLRRPRPTRPPPPSAEETAPVAATLGAIGHAPLRDALARLGAMLKRP